MNENLQDHYAPHNICFGCGTANPKGLRIKSFVEGDFIVCEWTPENHHQAYEGMMSGGIIGTLLDCHSNWAAAYYLMKHNNEEHVPCTVTANYSVKLMRPTPTNGPVHLKAWLKELKGDDRCIIEAELEAGGNVCATCSGLFVAVKPGHPAYHRWR